MAAALCLTLPGPAAAQNAANLAIELHGVDADRSEPLQKAAFEAARNVQGYLQAPWPRRLAIDFVGSDDDFAAVMAAHHVTGWDERWLAGLALLDQDRVIVHVNGTRALSTRETLEHELVHVAMHQGLQGRGQPRWYQEGAAMLLTGEATWERMKSMAGAAPLGQLDSLDDLDNGLLGSAVEKERAYATAGAFVQFAVRRAASDRQAIAELQSKMRGGLPFDEAFLTTFGQSAAALYAVFAEQMQATASAWSLLLTDNALWSLMSVLSAIALVQAWRRRPKFDDPSTETRSSPLDLEAIAAAGEAAFNRPWRSRDFSKQPLKLANDSNDDGAASELAGADPLCGGASENAACPCPHDGDQQRASGGDQCHRVGDEVGIDAANSADV